MHSCEPVNVHGYWIHPISIYLFPSFKISHKITCYNLTLTFIASSPQDGSAAAPLDQATAARLHAG